MPLIIAELKLPLQAEESSLNQIAARALGVGESDLRSLILRRSSLDARKKQDIFFSCTVEVTLSGKLEAALLQKGLRNVSEACFAPPVEPELGECPLPAPIIVAGMGPAGLFAAYQLANYGYRPILLERGEAVEARSRAVEGYFSGAGLNEQSNVMFGEGGAGTFSDGKLTTRIKDPRAHTVLDILAQFGAPQGIRTAAKPHIGTDKLIQTVRNMRLEILRLGGDIRFGAQLTGIEQKDGRVCAVRVLHAGKEDMIPCAACILATGQGARDTYQLLYDMGLELQQKEFAVGVRVEHPREVIDAAQFGAMAGHPRLGAAEYHLAGRQGDRGVYTFCMCPGGVVIASASGAMQVVTNGMSDFARGAAQSNAAIVVQVRAGDYRSAHPLAGLRFQQELEQAAWRLGGGDGTAPAQRICDFMANSAQSSFGAVRPTYRPGVRAESLQRCLPDFVAQGIREGILQFGRKLHGFGMGDAVLTAVESRTSAPVRIVRQEDGQATRLKGLYPVGEGAGYAGGIVSAAVDGLRAAQRLMALYRPA
ncbi:MAG: hypothetical protein LBN26_02370 [Christensenellaceae bacterium]|jgi:uncharacterized FAD-dependent dehydrogenase|nr:hypothetical protein [Christensenellaceae bacterium]